MGYKPRCRSKRHRKLKTAFMKLLIHLNGIGVSYKELSEITDLDVQTINHLTNNIMEFYR